ncbi:hypothetical protein K1719_008906 [Acacia pycnantha]|nr:hypothetical protein K1719_008906 [Acacia pycnantha]
MLIYRHFGVNRRSVFRVKVFLFRTRLWKEVEFGNLKGLFVVDDPVSVNGHVFWLVFKPCVDDRNCRVVSFDIANKVFSLIPMPAEDDSVEMQSQVLTVHENNLAMLWVKFATEDIYRIKLWVMDEDSNEFKILDISECGSRSGIMIHNYVESLVSISNFHVENP